eukprot:TRINITY_DN266_c0_g1_i1.p1 TRINITY_DN266_c0_g1~~TRINITY_DN266_c0_g1_i1.p1  ORF type:complete len:104 (-),score=20.95 TRINITY_DN266_c0_g1_i1:163-474(-)
MALVMRIKFPPSYPLIYKTLRIDSKLTTQEAISFISETLNVPVDGYAGLYIPQERFWLDDNTPLSEYPQLQEVEEVEFRNKDGSGGDSGKKPSAGDGSCCILY